MIIVADTGVVVLVAGHFPGFIVSIFNVAAQLEIKVFAGIAAVHILCQQV